MFKRSGAHGELVMFRLAKSSCATPAMGNKVLAFERWKRGLLYLWVLIFMSIFLFRPKSVNDHDPYAR